MGLQILRDYYISPHFKRSELACKGENCCSHDCFMDEQFIELLEELREHTGRLLVTSAYRCLPHNKKVGGCLTSRHLHGCAVDVVPLDISLEELVRLANEYFNEVIFYPDKEFVHIGFE